MIRVAHVRIQGAETQQQTEVVLHVMGPDWAADRELLYRHARSRGWTGAELLAHPYDEDGAR